MYIVLITYGKREDVDSANVMLFETFEEAQNFVSSFNPDNLGKKYWKKAQIVSEGEMTEDLCGYQEKYNEL